jgi:hypothetical protein
MPRRCHQAAVLALAVPVLASGTALLASNSVPVSHAGVTQVKLPVVTALVAGSNATINVSRAANNGFYRLTGTVARLSANGTPVAGEPVDIAAAGGLICTAVTDFKGRAVCPGDTKVDTSKFSSVQMTFTATFAGDDGLQGSSDTGVLSTIS